MGVIKKPKLRQSEKHLKEQEFKILFESQSHLGSHFLVVPGHKAERRLWTPRYKARRFTDQTEDSTYPAEKQISRPLTSSLILSLWKPIFHQMSITVKESGCHWFGGLRSLVHQQCHKIPITQDKETRTSCNAATFVVSFTEVCTSQELLLQIATILGFW